MPRAKSPRITVRRWKPEDLPGIVQCHRDAYTDFPASEATDERTYRMQLEMFPEGQFLAECEGKIVGYATSLIVQL